MVALVVISVISLGLAVWAFRLRTRLTLLQHRLAGTTEKAWELTVTGGWLNSTGRRVAAIAVVVVAAYSVAMLLTGWLLAQAF